MRAVATVVMNRVHVPNGEYLRVNQGVLRNVIFQAGQFDCTFSTIRGKPNPQNIYNANPESIHLEIADWALEGNIFGPVSGCLWYMNPYAPCILEFPRNGSGILHTRINNHCFYRPTAAYIFRQQAYLPMACGLVSCSFSGIHTQQVFSSDCLLSIRAYAAFAPCIGDARDKTAQGGRHLSLKSNNCPAISAGQSAGPLYQ